MSSIPLHSSDSHSAAYPESSATPLGRSGATDHTARELHSAASAVAWGAILAGAAGAAALSLVLLRLGTGLGLSAVSPWARTGLSASALGWSAIVWVTLTQIAAAGLGGYLAGRLRSRWLVAHRDEVYFRDTAHGLLAWAVATLGTAALLTSTVSSVVGTGASVTAGAFTAGAALVRPEDANASVAYYVDRVLRKDSTGTVAGNTAPNTPAADLAVVTDPRTPEMIRLFGKNLKAGKLADDDLRYAGQWVAQRTGLSQDQAQARVITIYTEAQTALRNADAMARETANAARKTSSYTALWLVVALLLGAFSASVAATLGGRQRDN